MLGDMVSSSRDVMILYMIHNRRTRCLHNKYSEYYSVDVLQVDVSTPVQQKNEEGQRFRGSSPSASMQATRIISHCFCILRWPKAGCLYWLKKYSTASHCCCSKAECITESQYSQNQNVPRNGRVD